MVVLDTCAVIWLAEEPWQLSKAATEKIEQGRRSMGLGIAGVTLYELAWLMRHDRISITSASTPDLFLAEVEAQFLVLPVTAKIAQLAVNLPQTYPADPTDRTIGATALAHGGVLITRDKAIRRSRAVPVVW